ncbi:MAG: DUF523 domain-containing protein [Nitrospirota bacterium]
MFIVSACLAGINTRYNGKACGNTDIMALVARGKAFPVCPEQLGGLPTPREPIELVGGDGADLLVGRARAIGIKTGKNYTENFLRGAKEVLKIAKMLKIKTAILKDGSPSCGYTYIKVGGRRVKGRGVTTAAFLKAGIKVTVGDVRKKS